MYLKYVYLYISLSLLKEKEETNRPNAEIMAEDVDLDLYSSTDVSPRGAVKVVVV